MKFLRGKKYFFKLIYLLLLLSYSDNSIGQNIDKSALFGNTKFEVLRKSTSLNDKTNTNPSALYLKVNLSQSVKDSFNKLSSKYIWRLLNDSSTSWTANLLLYEKYEKDAYLFFAVIHSRKEWLPMWKEDLKYWKIKLKI